MTQRQKIKQLKKEMLELQRDNVNLKMENVGLKVQMNNIKKTTIQRKIKIVDEVGPDFIEKSIQQHAVELEDEIYNNDDILKNMIIIKKHNNSTKTFDVELSVVFLKREELY